MDHLSVRTLEQVVQKLDTALLKDGLLVLVVLGKRLDRLHDTQLKNGIVGRCLKRL